MVGFLLYGIKTWQICIGLETQTYDISATIKKVLGEPQVTALGEDDRSSTQIYMT